ncbi:MAG: gamma-glutamyltransferase [Gammaproteobacteria bacterium]
MKGAVAAGHPATAEAAAWALEEGGNAFDAALAGLCAACVAEPVLTSLGGGGFLLAHHDGGRNTLYDFFVQTPLRKRSLSELDFYPIVADFGTAQQEFHIGRGSIATPGTVKGLLQIHSELGTLPIREIVQPAVDFARNGIVLNRLQAYIFSVVAPIYLATRDARRIYSSSRIDASLAVEGEKLRQPDLADALELLAIEGERLFYQGEMGAQLVAACESGGGYLQKADLADYQVLKREPLGYRYLSTRILTNPLPSSGGSLIRFAHALLEPHDQGEFGSVQHLELLAEVMKQTNLARVENGQTANGSNASILHADTIARYRSALAGHPVNNRGTTHISVVDASGNAASLSLSNGEGSGHVLPGTGIMLNNMLGEEDLNPGGFHQWNTDVRVSSMMSPTLAIDHGRVVALGSGGSNRLRTAILQTLNNLYYFGMDVHEAVNSPRLHVEKDLLSIEPGFPETAVAAVCARYPELHRWSEQNLFFGGTHTVIRDGHGFSGAGDPRRGGVFLAV